MGYEVRAGSEGRTVCVWRRLSERPLGQPPSPCSSSSSRAPLLVPLLTRLHTRELARLLARRGVQPPFERVHRLEHGGAPPELEHW